MRSARLITVASAVVAAIGCGDGGTTEDVVAGVDVAFVAVDDTNLYWTERPGDGDGGDGAIKLAKKQSPTDDVTAIGTGRELVALGDGALAWVDAAGTVSRRAPDGTVARLFERAGAQDRGLTRDQGHLYLALAVPATATARSWEVWSIPLDGTAPMLLASETSDALPFDLAPDEVHLYFTLASGGSPAAAGQIRRVPLAGGATEVFLDDVPGAQRLALDGGNVYWTAAATLDDPGAPTGRIFRTPKAGGLSDTLASLWGDGELAIDARSLFWAGPAEGMRVALARIPLDGSAPATLVVRPGMRAADVALDATRIYWTLWNTPVSASALLRTTKP